MTRDEPLPYDCELALDVVDSPVVILDVALRIRRLNRSALLLCGTPAKDLVGHPLSALGSAEPWPKASALVARLTPGGRLEGQIEDLAADRSWSVLVGHVGEGEIARIIVQARDITLHIKLQDAQRHIERLGAHGALIQVAHQVRNPLFAISGAVDAFEARFGASEAHARYFEILRHNVARVTGLMQELLEYAKPGSPELREGSLAEVLAIAERSCAVLAEQAGVTFSARLPPELPRVRCDRAQLAQCFENLLENAVQHSPAGAAVVIEAEPVTLEGAPWVECRVLDSGPGLRSVERVFEPFFTRRRGGTGLGLAIAERIVERHGGRIAAENRPEGGARFRVLLRAC